MLHGIIPLYKPKGMTSHDCVIKIRKLLHMKKVGHTGTLDPEVEGVLPICIGDATKIIPFLVHLKKEYIANVTLGTSTTTEDAEGEVIAEKRVTTMPNSDEISSVIDSFRGIIEQTPPMYSAVKVNGKRLYEYARQNIEVERPTREITIHEIEQLKATEKLSDQAFQIRVLCSKGTYIRTLCVDIGEKLGYPAHMSYLIRTESDSFTLNETVTFDDIETAIAEETFKNLLQPIEKCVETLPAIIVDENQKNQVLQGQKFSLPDELPTIRPFKMMYHNQLLAMYDVHPTKDNEIKPVRVFNTHKE